MYGEYYGPPRRPYEEPRWVYVPPGIDPMLVERMVNKRIKKIEKIKQEATDKTKKKPKTFTFMQTFTFFVLGSIPAGVAFLIFANTARKVLIYSLQ